MGNTAGGLPAEAVVGWTQLPRNTTHKTSPVTDQKIRGMVSSIQLARNKRPTADAVILAGMKLLELASDDVVLELVKDIERARYSVHRAPGGEDPGE
jgi:hypothetical protein